MFKILSFLFAICSSAMASFGDDPDGSTGSIASIEHRGIDHDVGPWISEMPDARISRSNLDRLSDGLFRHHLARQFSAAASMAQESANVQRLIGMEPLAGGFDNLAFTYQRMNQWSVSGQSIVEARQILAHIRYLLRSPESFINAGLQMLYGELENLLINNMTIRESIQPVLARLNHAHSARDFGHAARHAEELVNLYHALGKQNLCCELVIQLSWPMLINKDVNCYV